MTKTASTSSKGAIDLLEQAVHLLRGAPASLYCAYAIGVLPFLLAFLYFWADMSRGAFAREHAGAAAFAIALLYLWMKCWQSVFAAGLRACWTGHKPAPWTISRIGGMALAQIVIQPSALFAVPAALVVALPFVWVFGFYQNVTVTGGEFGGLAALCKRATRQASLQQGQAHLLAAILLFFGLFLWLNIVTAMAITPGLLKTLLGIDTALSRAGVTSLLNTTFLASSFALAYLCLDPLIKAVYVLRCFYGESLTSGEDLQVEFALAVATENQK